jgi:hypothetical protein
MITNHYIYNLVFLNSWSVTLSQFEILFVKIMEHNPKQPIKTEKPSLRFRGALKNLSEEQKEKNNQNLQNLRNEWQRDI